MNSNWFVSEAICNHKRDKDLVSIDLRRRRNALPLPPPLTTSQEIPTTLLHTPLRAPIVRSHSNIQTFPRHSFSRILIPRTSLKLTTANHLRPHRDPHPSYVTRTHHSHSTKRIIILHTSPLAAELPTHIYYISSAFLQSQHLALSVLHEQ